MKEVIDLLSSDDDDDDDECVGGSVVKECKANSWPSLQSNDDDGTMTKRLRVTDNEYANAWLREKGHTTCPKTNKLTTSHSEHTAVKNPYAKKNPLEGTATKAQLIHNSIQIKKRKTMTLQQPRELQAGLVFGEDVHHHNNSTAATNTRNSSNHNSQGIFPTTSSSSSLLPLKSIDIDDNNDDNDDESIMQYPSSAHAYIQNQLSTRIVHNLPPILYHDLDFVAGNPSTIDGSTKTLKQDQGETSIPPPPPKCKCRPSKLCKLVYSTKADSTNFDRPYYCCSSTSGCSYKNNNNDNNNNNDSSSSSRGGCGYFAWAFTSYTMHWYRFGTHNGHQLVNNKGFCAQDLVQGKVGDCWFLSALAVVAERSDLINRLIGGGRTNSTNNENDNYGVVEVTLFVDGHWKTIIMDNFLPCIIDIKGEKDEEESIQLALSMSLETSAAGDTKDRQQCHIDTHNSSSSNSNKQDNNNRLVSSKFDRNVMADYCRHTLQEIKEYLHSDRFAKDPYYRANYTKSTSYIEQCTQPLQRKITTSDLAYSKTRQKQLWCQYIEKAYAKIHGSYRAISGGQIEEAFLDLTGAPTIVYYFDHMNFNPVTFWNALLQFRSKKLPMGCGTSTSQVGLVGRHAYSILDVREVHNIGLDFFRDKLVNWTLGNVSGFTEFDGTVRLLRIRNPHGQGEWKGEFSDTSPVWESLMSNKYKSTNQGIVDLTTTTTTTTTATPQSPILERTMVNDGCFWIDYDSFLMGFTNVDVVLAFEGNHAMSFNTNFPTKLSNHRCSRAFEISTIERQPGDEIQGNNMVEVYVMIIQKTKRGASLGRVDRKVSYKACDVGIIVSERCSKENELDSFDGRFFGLTRNGHIRLLLDRSLPDRKLIVMPISFGHPSATDDERSFVVRVVSDAPLLLQELSKTPEMNVVIQKFCFENHRGMSLNSTGTSKHMGTQGTRSILFEHRKNKTYIYKIFRIDCLAGDGGTVLLYLVVNDKHLSTNKAEESISFSIEINCRGMVCRTANGPENHEVVSKGKKFEAAWRRFSLSFVGESKSRLLAVVVQGGQDYEMGSIKCMKASASSSSSVTGPMSKFMNAITPSVGLLDKYRKYEDFGVFASVKTPPDNQVDCVNLSSLVEVTTIDSTEQIEMNAAILASMTDSHVASSESLSFDQEIEQAIALSLKDH